MAGVPEPCTPRGGISSSVEICSFENPILQRAGKVWGMSSQSSWYELSSFLRREKDRFGDSSVVGEKSSDLWSVKALLLLNIGVKLGSES